MDERLLGCVLGHLVGPRKRFRLDRIESFLELKGIGFLAFLVTLLPRRQRPVPREPRNAAGLHKIRLLFPVG